MANNYNNNNDKVELCYPTVCVALTFGERLLATGSLGEDLLALGDGPATESDTLLSVEDGTLPDEALDATGTAIDLVEGDLVDDLGTVLPAKRRRNVSIEQHKQAPGTAALLR
jgi:hypothetical protein